MAKRNLLLEYSEELAVKIANLCNEYKIDSNTVFQIKKYFGLGCFWWR